MFSLNSQSAGLGIITTVQVPTAGEYFIKGKITVPTIPTGSAHSSQVIVTVNQNGSPIYVGPLGARGVSASANCAAQDVITVVLTSSLAEDNAANAVNSTISIGDGI